MVYFQKGIRGTVLCATVAKIISDEMIYQECSLDGFPEISIDRDEKDNLEFSLNYRGKTNSFSITQKQAVDLQQSALKKTECSQTLKELIISEFIKLEHTV